MSSRDELQACAENTIKERELQLEEHNKLFHHMKQEVIMVIEDTINEMKEEMAKLTKKKGEFQIKSHNFWVRSKKAESKYKKLEKKLKRNRS